jgi:PAS domain S-box-containing protein
MVDQILQDDKDPSEKMALPARDELYRIMAKNFPNGVVLLFDQDLRYILVDGMGLLDIGIKSHELEGRTIWEYFPPDVCEQLEPHYRATLAGKSSEFEVPFLGHIYHIHTLPITEADGSITKGLAMTQDITERKRTELVLRESQQRYEQLVNSLESIVWEGDAQTFQYYFVSKQAERLLGYPLERWTSEPDFWAKHIHPEDREWAIGYCALSTAQRRDHEFEYRMIAADGRVLWLRDIVTVVVEDDQPTKLRGVMIDITENKRIESELHEREQQYRSIFESVNDGLFINSLSTNRLVDFNPAAARMHGYTEDEFLHLQPPDFIHPDSLHLFNDYMDVVRDGGIFRSPAVDIRKDGSTFHVEVMGTGLKYKGELHALGVVRDVDDQYRAFQLLEQRVQERTQELQTLLEVSRSITSTLDLTTMLGIALDQLKGIVDFTGAAIYTVRGEGLELHATRGIMVEHAISWPSYPRDNPIDHAILNENQPVVIPDVLGDTSLARAFRRGVGDRFKLIPAGVYAWLGVPLVVKDDAIGMLVLLHLTDHYHQHHADLVMTLANHIAIAIENARLYQNSQILVALQERQKLARELHDSVSQALYGIGLGVQTARKMLDIETAKKSDLRDPLDYVMSQVDAGLAEMRALIFELRPESLENEGLIAALNKQAAALEARHNLPVITNLANEPVLPFEVKEALYRIGLEAMNNVVKHAKATQVMLGLQVKSDAIMMEIRDDGIGFDPESPFPGHLGLRSMRERAERFGGHVCIDSTPGKGTRVLVQLPV